MVCITSCLLSAVLLSGMISVMLVSQYSPIHKNFFRLLDNNQKVLYKKIVHERLTLFLQGLIIGLICAVLITPHLKYKKKTRVCIFILISVGILNLYYLLFPKSTYMLEHLNTREQITAWNNIRLEMRFKKILGMILGLVGYYLLANNTV